jgi:Taurine catabolism dioxygenase TauD, TfdA family
MSHHSSAFGVKRRGALHVLVDSDSIPLTPVKRSCAEDIIMATTVYPVTQGFAAEIGDVGLSEQIGPADLQAIKEAFTQYAVLIFPDQHLSQDQHLDFAKHFGPLETTIGVHRKDAPLRLRKEFADVAAAIHLHPSLAGKRPRHVGQSVYDAPWNRVRRPALEARRAARDGF